MNDFQALNPRHVYRCSCKEWVFNGILPDGQMIVFTDDAKPDGEFWITRTTNREAHGETYVEHRSKLPGDVIERNYYHRHSVTCASERRREQRAAGFA